jgi:hypothetical protein
MKGRQLLYPEATLKFVAERFFTNLQFNGGRLADEDKIECYTEDIFNGDEIHAHPNYQSEGESFDWISVKYESLIKPAAGRVLMIFDFRKQKFLSVRVSLRRNMVQVTFLREIVLRMMYIF